MTGRQPKYIGHLLRIRRSTRDPELIDNLAEVFHERMSDIGPRKARWLYRRDVLDLLLFGSGRLEKPSYQTSHIPMIGHYLKITVRTLGRQPGYGMLNTASLSIGLGVCLLVFLFVRDERTFDRFHDDADRLFRLTQTSFSPDGTPEQEMSTMPYAMGPNLVSQFEQVEESVSIIPPSNMFVKAGETVLGKQLVFATTDFFDLLTFPFSQGDAVGALDDPDSVVLTEALAVQLFGAGNVLGKTISVRLGDSYHDLTVTGVARSIPSNSSIQFDLVVPFERYYDARPEFRDYQTIWDVAYVQTFVRLRDETLPGAFESSLNSLDPHLLKGEYGDGSAESEGPRVEYRLQPITSIHSEPGIMGTLGTPRSPTYASILAAIAIVILLIACINFTTLAIARSTGRSKEIGMRRVIGAKRTQLIQQFLGESFLISTAGAIGAVILGYSMLPFFNQLAQQELVLSFDSDIVLLLVGLAVAAGLLSGFYPALILSGLAPLDVFRNRIHLGGSSGFARSLVVLQFALSILMIVSALVMQNQMAFTRSRDLGFTTDRIVSVDLQGIESPVELDRFRSRLMEYPQIEATTAIDHPLTGFSWVDLVEIDGAEVEVMSKQVDSEYLEVLGGRLLAGRWFEKDRKADERAIVVNREFVDQFNIVDPVGHHLGEFVPQRSGDGPEIIGVLDNFNFKSLHEPMAPLYLIQSRFSTFKVAYRHLYVKVTADDPQSIFARIREAWTEVVTDMPVQLSFLDDDLQTYYETDQRWSRIVQFGAFIAVFIACMGLLGLAAAMVAKRTHEVGIRKALGANGLQITGLFVRDFSWLVVLGFVLAVPIAGIAMQKWLQTFAFRIDLGPGVFLLGGAFALSMAILAVGAQSIKAARTNPVKCLRHE